MLELIYVVASVEDIMNMASHIVEELDIKDKYKDDIKQDICVYLLTKHHNGKRMQISSNTVYGFEAKLHYTDYVRLDLCDTVTYID